MIVNSAAGPGHADETYNEMRRLFASHGMEADILAAEDGKALTERTREALKSRPPIVVAAGGDGTVSRVASLVRGTGTTLGVLPMGTLNHFARDLGIPLELKDAVDVIARGSSVEVDVGEVNGRTFINNASLGLYPHIVRHRQRRQERYGNSKYWAMLWATLAVVGRNPFLKLELQMDERVQRCRTPFVFVGNNDYVMEGFHMGKRSSMRDGLLSVYTTRRHGPMPLVRLAFRALFGRLKQADDFSMEQARHVRVRSRRHHLLVATDGEVSVLETPLEFRVVPGALRVMQQAGT